MTRALAYERIRALSIKSTYVFPATGLVLSWALAFLMVRIGEELLDYTMADLVNSAYTSLTVLFVTVPFAQAFGHDFRDGTIRLTLSEFPHRAQVFVAKLVVPAVIAAVAALVSVTGIVLVGLTGPSVSFDGLPALTARLVAFTVMWGLLVASVTVLTRIMAAGIAGVLVWALIVEPLLSGLLGERLPLVADVLPIQQGSRWVASGDAGAGLVMLVVTAVLVGAAYLRFSRRDA